jgi:hypothetical protein
MNLGIVGPLEIVNKITQIIKSDFHQIEPFIYYYRDYTEVVKLFQEQPSHLEAILFSGYTPFSYAEKHIKPVIPWEFVPRSTTSLLQVLLKITLSQKYSIYKISSDLYDMEQLTEIFQEIGISKDLFCIYSLPKAAIGDDYIDYVYKFHKENYQINHISCCITAYYHIYEKLSKEAIPCFLVEPTASVIRETLRKLQLKYLVHVSQQSQLVALYIRIDSPNEYSLFNDNEYQYIIDKTNVTRQIYLFAQQIQAAVVEVGNQEFLLFSTKQLLENITNHFSKIDLLEMIMTNTASTISLGIGYGKTAREAKFSASVGMVRASKLGGNRAFIVYGGNKIVGPIFAISNDQPTDESHKIDKKFLAISEKSGISINTIFRLHSIIENQGKPRFTAFELANLMGVTTRTMNRILTKLTLHGFCFEVGKRVLTTAGRPSRIVEIVIP